jgi:hypothetical protein
MPNIPRIVSTPVDYVSTFSLRFMLRLGLSVLLTSLDAGVVARYGVTLYRVSVGHPFWLVGVTLLFTIMLASLLRVWVLTLRGRFS